jgi:hypothetical protein
MQQIGRGSLVGGEGGLNSKRGGGVVSRDDRSQDRKTTEEGSEEETRKSFKEVVKGNPGSRGKDIEMGGVCNGKTETQKKDEKEINL